ncbi:MAG: ThuA domain-containing protein [Isosphaeraceae bacterium]
MRTLLLAPVAALVAAWTWLPLAGTARADEPPARIRALLITGANNHNWKDTTAVLESTLGTTGTITVDVSTDPEAPVLDDAAKLATYQVIVLNFNRNNRWKPEREANFLKFVRDGGGLVVYHASDNAFNGWEEYDRLVGGTWRSKGTAFPERGTFHPPYGPFDVTIVDPKHPITAGLGTSFSARDEMYSNLKLQDNIHVLAQGQLQGKPQPLLFVLNYGKGRVFQTALGHDVEAMKNPKFKDTLIRGTRWAAGQLGTP